MKKIIRITESELKRLIESKLQLSERQKFNQAKFEAFLNSFPDNATSWSQATEELVELYDMLLDYHNDIYGDEPSMIIQDKNISKSKSPSEFNKKFKKLIREILNQTTDDVKDYVYNHYQHWFENVVTEENTNSSKFQIGNKFLFIDDMEDAEIVDIQKDNKTGTYLYKLSNGYEYINEPSLQELIDMEEVKFLG